MRATREKSIIYPEQLLVNGLQQTFITYRRKDANRSTYQKKIKAKRQKNNIVRVLEKKEKTINYDFYIQQNCTPVRKRKEAPNKQTQSKAAKRDAQRTE